MERLYTQRVATFLLMPDGDPERGWCCNGDPCYNGSGLECLTIEMTTKFKAKSYGVRYE